MRWTKWLCAFLCVLVATQVAALAAGGRPFQVMNRLRVEYDDNIRQQDEGKSSSLKLIEEPEFHFDMSGPQTFVSLRYRPSLVWWQDRPEEDFDFHHDMDLVLNHSFTPRLSFGMKDTLRVAELPELIDHGNTIRQNDDFIYNTLNASLSVITRPDTRLDISGRHVLLRYDEEDVGNREDYDIIVGGLTLRHQVIQETAVFGDLRYEDTSYDGESNRGSSTLSAGAGLEHTFSQNLLGSLRAGFSQKQFDDSEIEDEDSPYIDATLTILPTPATRVTVGTGYSLFESGIYPFANQQRTRFFISLAQDITAKISYYLSGVYTMSDYDAEQIPSSLDYSDTDEILAEGGTPLEYEDGSEDVYQFSARVTYKVNRSNWLEAGWQYSQLESELDSREDFKRNRVHLGWKIKI